MACIVLAEREYYERQVSTLKSFEEVDSLEQPTDVNEEEERQEQAQHERAMNLSNWANVILLLLKVKSTLIPWILSFSTPHTHTQKKKKKKKKTNTKRG